MKSERFQISPCLDAS